MTPARLAGAEITGDAHEDERVLDRHAPGVHEQARCLLSDQPHRLVELRGGAVHDAGVGEV